MTVAINEEANLVSNRTCGTCTLCCKVMRIDALQKPMGVWCSQCTPGKGCKIYDTRPDECRVFYCLWRVDSECGDIWRPERCKMVVYVEGMGNRIAISVDPGAPTKWREEPWYSQIKAWSLDLLTRRRQVVVYIANRVIAVLPNKDIDLGPMQTGDSILTGKTETGEWDAMLVSKESIPEEKRGKWFDSGREI